MAIVVMTVAVNDRPGGWPLRRKAIPWITAAAKPVAWMTIAVDDRRSDDRRNDGCRDDANVVAIDDCRSNELRGGWPSRWRLLYPGDWSISDLRAI